MDAPPKGPAWIEARATKTNSTALTALCFAFAGFVCLWGAGGALAVALGLIAHREITRSDPSESGRGLATTAIVLGMVNLVATAGAVVAGIAFLANRVASPHVLAAPPRITKAPAPSAPAPRPHPPKPRASASYDRGDSVTTLGSITLVDLGIQSGTLGRKLEKQHAEALAASEPVLLWIVAPACRPCDGVAAALRDPSLQRELGRVRLVRIDATDFPVELEQLGISTEKIPGFALLDAHNRLRDFIHGGEWDADVAPNIAPVLGKFLRGEYRSRRHPWHDRGRANGTPT